MSKRVSQYVRHLVTVYVLTIVVGLLCCIVLVPATVSASSDLIIDDQAQLLAPYQRQWLRDDYQDLTNYAEVALVTTNAEHDSAEQYAHDYVNRKFGKGPAIIFLIDMHQRQIWVYANEAGLGLISRADARAITDNVYTYASDRDYYACADAAFTQIRLKCTGGHIARPVKHISNALIAMVLAVLVNYWYTAHARTKAWEDCATGEGTQGEGVLPDFVLSEPELKIIERIYGSGGYDGGGGGGGFDF